jgi:hypothetical protein
LKARVALVALGAVAVAFLVIVTWSLWPAPQMGANREVFATVDALFTAVTARDEERLRECERHLRGHREAGKLPAQAADHLDGIIRQARAGSWQAAAERLYHFMRAQRREGRAAQAPQKALSEKRTGR